MRKPKPVPAQPKPGTPQWDKLHLGITVYS